MITRRHTLFIDGEWLTPALGTPVLNLINPATASTLATLATASTSDVDAAVASARCALPDWQNRSASERAGFLRAMATQLQLRSAELVALCMQNNGKPQAEAEIDLQDAIACFEYYAHACEELAAKQNSPVHLPQTGFQAALQWAPVGVVGLIVPWNFPLVTSAWKIAPALAAGCTVVLKPSEVTALIELVWGDIAQAVSLPAGVLNIVLGDGTVGAALCQHPDVAKISFTGSNRVGSQVMQTAAASVKNIALELGGKSPIIVFDDVDLDQAVDWIIGGIFYNCGQMCSATSRLLVHQSIAAELLHRLKAASEGIVVGPASDPGSQMGPLSSQAQYRSVLKYIQQGIDSGLTLLSGGGPVPTHKDGYFIQPTIFADVPTDHPLWREEIFGPVLCSHTFADEAEAIALANDSDFGLAATVLSRDETRARRVAAQLQAGHIWLNSLQVVLPETSWGGFKRSGIGRELGPWGLQAYLEIKHIVAPVQHSE